MAHEPRQHGDDGRGGMPLESFTRSTPPGWRPGVTSYPLRRYKQLLALWWRQTDLEERFLGPAMAGRLRGTAFQLAMAMRENRYDPIAQAFRVFEGDELLAQGQDAGHVAPDV